MQEDLNDARAVGVQVAFQIHDRSVSVMPKLFVMTRGVRDRFAAQDIAMHALRAILEAGRPPLRQKSKVLAMKARTA
ncbi:MAG: hypothetical protein ABI224_12035, partial [Acetobacteraceae bacterium]